MVDTNGGSVLDYGVKNLGLAVPFGVCFGIAGTAFFLFSTCFASWIRRAIEFSMDSTSLSLSTMKLYLNRYRFLFLVSCLTILLTASSDSSSLGSTCFRLSRPINNRLSMRFRGWKPSKSLINLVLLTMYSYSDVDCSDGQSTLVLWYLSICLCLFVSTRLTKRSNDYWSLFRLRTSRCLSYLSFVFLCSF